MVDEQKQGTDAAKSVLQGTRQGEPKMLIYSTSAGFKGGW